MARTAASEVLTDRRRHLTLRDWLVLFTSVGLGLLFAYLERTWYRGALAAIAVWIVAGLVLQAGDFSRRSVAREASGEGQRPSWFAIVWRLAIAGSIIVCLLLRALLATKLVAFQEDDDAWFYYLSPNRLLDAWLLCSYVIAIASSSRFTRPPAENILIRSLAWMVFGILCAILLRDYLLVLGLVHITIAGIGLAQRLPYPSEAFAVCNPDRLQAFLLLATIGVTSLLVSLGALRLLAAGWHLGRRRRTLSLGSLAVSVVAMVVLTVRLAVVEFPRINPLLAAHLTMPGLLQGVLAGILACFLVTAAAWRWSMPPGMRQVAKEPFSKAACFYHQQRWLVLLLGGVVAVEWFVCCAPQFYGSGYHLGWMRYLCRLADLFELPNGTLVLAIMLMAVQTAFSFFGKPLPSTAAARRPFSTALFALVWSSMLVIMLAGVPILAACGLGLACCFGGWVDYGWPIYGASMALILGGAGVVAARWERKEAA